MIHYSQHDPRWSDRRVGTGRQTFAQVGCLVCAVADMLVAAGIDTDPLRLNRWLGQHGGFVGGNLFVFSTIEPLGVTLENIVDCSRIPAPMDDVEATLAMGGWVLAKVDFSPWTAAVNQHWVRVLEVYDNDCLIADPWLPPGGAGETLLMPRYARASWPNPARAIFRLVSYQPVGAIRPFDGRVVQHGRWELNWKR